MDNLSPLLNLSPTDARSFLGDLGYYVYALCEIDSDRRRLPIYIGKGKGDRCLQHLKETKESEKLLKIADLMAQNRLGIDILAYDLDQPTSFIVESVCIDLMNVENLTNAVRGHGENTKRLPLNELASLRLKKRVEVLPEHQGVAFLLERSYQHDFGDLAILEHTRGIWRSKQPDNVKYAYATYRGIVKEVYEIYTWVPAGTQQYFTRALDPTKSQKRWEFVGKKAAAEIRNRYVGNLIWKRRSFGDPYVKVGFGNDL